MNYVEEGVQGGNKKQWETFTLKVPSAIFDLIYDLYNW